MRLRALAKINLGLDILRKREDGYHEVRMIMQTIQMYDVLEMKRVRKPGISLSVNYSYIPNDERNLVYKAAKLLMDEFQVKKPVDPHQCSCRIRASACHTCCHRNKFLKMDIHTTLNLKFIHQKLPHAAPQFPRQRTGPENVWKRPLIRFRPAWPP